MVSNAGSEFLDYEVKICFKDRELDYKILKGKMAIKEEGTRLNIKIHEDGKTKSVTSISLDDILWWQGEIIYE